MILSQEKLSQKDFAKKIDVNEKTVSAWKKNNSLPPLDKISNISDCLGVSIDYLLTGQEKSSSTDRLSDDEQELLDIYKGLSTMNKGRLKERAAVLAEMEVTTIPKQKEPKIIQTTMLRFEDLSVSAGTGEPLDEGYYHTYIKVKKSETVDEADFAVKVAGDSMSPHFKDGDIVLVHAQPEVKIGEIGIFTINNDGYIKKRGRDRLISLNPEYEDIYFEEGQEIRCKGLVIGTLEDDDFI